MARKDKAIKLHERQFVLPTKDELLADGVVSTTDGYLRRVVIPQPKFWQRVKQCGRKDAEHLVEHILITFGISPSSDMDKLPEPGFVTYTQSINLGVEETQKAATEEAVDGGLAETIIMNLADDDLMALVAKRLGWKLDSLKEALGFV